MQRDRLRFIFTSYLLFHCKKSLVIAFELKEKCAKLTRYLDVWLKNDKIAKKSLHQYFYCGWLTFAQNAPACYDEIMCKEKIDLRSKCSYEVLGF